MALCVKKLPHTKVIKMNYSNRYLRKLEEVTSSCCFEKVESWDESIYSSWLGYIKGEDRNILHKKTKFASFSSLKRYFRMHPCQPKISQQRKKFRKIKTRLIGPITSCPWLLGLHFADGCVKNKSQISFALSMHEKLIENRVEEELKKILGKNAHIAKEYVGNMRVIRTHSIELSDHLPKKDKDGFTNLWKNFSRKEKIQFMAGFIDGDGSCAFDVGIESIQIFSKDFPYILKEFKHLFLGKGQVTLYNISNGLMLYLSPPIGRLLKPFLIKKDIKRPYRGSVDVQRAMNLLKNKISIYQIAKDMSKSKKTVHLALKQVYGINEVKKYTQLTKRAYSDRYSTKNLEKYYKALIGGNSLYRIAKENGLHYSHIKRLLKKNYGGIKYEIS